MKRIPWYLLCVLAAYAGPSLSEPEFSLPDGFEATVFHEGLGKIRHIAVRDNGDVYVAKRFALEIRMFAQQASYGGLIALRDTDGDGVADVVEEFGPTDVTTGLAIHAGHLYFSSEVTVYRVPLDDNLVPAAVPVPIAGGFPLQGTHGSKTLAFDDSGNMYVNSGTPSNVCQKQNNKRESPGLDPCPQLERSGGIWRFAADKKLQDQVRDGERYVTGTRNVVALEWNDHVNQLYFVMHGRDSLDILWPDRFTREQRVELPAEEFHVAVAGDNFGWPYTYYDHRRGARMLGPEYGGDGVIEADGDYTDPLIGFPGHWAPNDLIFHSGTNVPERYRGGALIAFHGSWNRIPLPQAGYNVVFVPMKNGRPASDWEIFADGFTGAEEIRSPAAAKYRPTGLAEGPDGAIYLTEDKQGRIWRITWRD